MTGPAPAPAGSPWLLQAAAATSTLDRFVMPPMLIAMAVDLGEPLSAVVAAASAYFLAYGLMQPVWGMISDKLGLVRTMRISLVLSALATTVAAFTESAMGLGIARGLAGACFSAAVPAGLIYIGDTVGVDRRQREIASFMAAVAAGTALASVVGGLLAQVNGWRAAFIATGLITAAVAAALGRVPSPPRVRADQGVIAPMIAVLRSGSARLILLLAFTEGVVLLGVLTLLPSAVEAAGASASVAGAVTAVYGVAVLVFARVAGALSRRLHTSRLIAFGALAAVAACGLATLSRSPVAAALVACLLGLAWALMHSSLQTWATEVLPAARATVVSAFAGALFLGSAVAAALVGEWAEAARFTEIFGVATLIAVPLGLIATVARMRWTRPEGEPGR
ncbi:Predicted arabinose efflux permease, MFS family [Sinosporangium album]|uniref:Predicted arabinose efflux permease, MFS family n=1 Tax=Sinosporangium album TaxID=504805 RepID=A0A1G7T223_9ACTN|nr:MFS transporter [Sinosporangium album]SDG28719.1 Predicted arabinose efflux permease, MFS family [Sinosporangium album]